MKNQTTGRHSSGLKIGEFWNYLCFFDFGFGDCQVIRVHEASP
jgi:hypothetical protein